eukprot:1158129-Pelagomonas_calceolata.AAC.14
MLPTSALAFPEHALHGFMSCIKCCFKLGMWRCLCVSGAVLHPFWQEKVDFQACNKGLALLDVSCSWVFQMCCSVRFCGGHCGVVLVEGLVGKGVQADAGTDIPLRPLHLLAI